MRRSTYSLLLLIIVFGCSEKNKSENNGSQTDRIAEKDAIKSVGQNPIKTNKTDESIDVNVKDTFKIDFPLDSLLSFDSEGQLKKIFKSNVKRSVGYYPEGMGEYTNTLLFPDTKNEVEFVWADDSLNFSGLLYIELSDKDTDWKTKEGITIGTGIKELEKLNEKPFTFFGLGWDYSGMIDWQEGHLYDRKIFGSLEYPDDAMPKEFEGLLGDHEIKSSSELAQEAKLILGEITMRRNE